MVHKLTTHGLSNLSKYNLQNAQNEPFLTWNGPLGRGPVPRVSSHVRPFPCPPVMSAPRLSTPPAAHRPRKSRQWLLTPPVHQIHTYKLLLLKTMFIIADYESTAYGCICSHRRLRIALYRVGYWCTCGTPVVFIFFPRKQPINFLTNIFRLWERCFSSDYQPGRPMKWEPRTPLSEGPRSPLEHRRLPRARGGVGEGRTWRADMGRGGHDWHSRVMLLERGRWRTQAQIKLDIDLYSTSIGKLHNNKTIHIAGRPSWA